MAKIQHARAVTQVPARFPIQSYFDNALLSAAILNQATGDSIVDSTKQTAQTPGVGVALHPSSNSPVAIRFRGGAADSAEIILAPGQRLDVGSFESFDWGLPFGWLGGGTVLLYVLHRPDAFVDFPSGDQTPILFHRTRLAVAAAFPNGAGAPGAANWPLTFPWDNAIAFDGTPQGGSPIVNINPTAVMLRLRSPIAAPVTLSFVWRGTDDFDTDATGLVTTTTDLIEVDVSFPAVPAGSLALPVAWLPADLAKLGGAFTVVTAVDAAAAFVEAPFIDVVRYGTLS